MPASPYLTLTHWRGFESQAPKPRTLAEIMGQSLTPKQKSRRILQIETLVQKKEVCISMQQIYGHVTETRGVT
jgi:hypothetical protein